MTRAYLTTISWCKHACLKATFYPVTTVYLAGVVVAVGIAGGVFDQTVGLAVLTAITLIVVLVSMFREVQVVHHLVNSQRDALLERITELVNAMHEAGVDLPPREKAAQKAVMEDPKTARENNKPKAP